jgi:hypothetical protein
MVEALLAHDPAAIVAIAASGDNAETEVGSPLSIINNHIRTPA